MPTDTQRAPTFSERIDAEREEIRRRFRDTCSDGSCTVCAPLRAARAATDEAVKAVEGLVEAVREASVWDAGYNVALGRARWNAIVRAVDALTNTTGGARDE